MPHNDSATSHPISTDNTVRLTPQRIRLLEIFALTMASAQILATSGVFQTLRSAQRELKKLKDAGFLKTVRYPVPSTGAFRSFYCLLKSAKSHIIQETTVEHDSLTALFLVRLFMVCQGKNWRVRWYPPFSLKNKVCDGGVGIFHDHTPLRSIILETDMSTHNFPEISDKLAAYLPFLQNFPNRMLVFLVNDAHRATQIFKLSQEKMSETMRQLRQVVVLCPWQIPQITAATFGIAGGDVVSRDATATPSQPMSPGRTRQ